ncbi:SidA/IucD/PvdA family monooxygenase [Streptomyces malaysiensis subsp. malaysiensis]|uniref:L-lysine N6-monooxygenase MbtG n=1 Tax=Streptomyces malaysiensis TaxID=92644 RepID=A0ABX6W3Y4_STRMQ|nr:MULTISPECIES: SidA/IucD/PvdA family monooxygenase [Streptomyces]QPI55696.1 SidA/IucD/PvdA family monooxygenase [Streptomyces solisilvae]UHH17154.1 SidA/IucD/PvdA family monooxygenase [Streptomyces sp. HNM0561]
MSTAQPPSPAADPAPDAEPTAAGPATAADRPADLVGIGVGPFNLSLAALAHGVPALRTAFYEQRPAFHWHPGLLIDGATVQVPFLADLVTLADPGSPWTFLQYLKAHERLFPFYVAERFHIERAEYDAYCRWVSQQLPGLHFDHRVDAVRWDHEYELFEIDFTRLGPAGAADAHPHAPATAGTDEEGRTLGRAYARNLVLGVGTEPYVPEPLRPLADAPNVPVLHSSDYLEHRERLLATGHVTVIGSGQSGAEVFLDLLRNRPLGAEGLHWLARTPAFAPMEYGKLGLEQFSPDYTRYFHTLSEPVRDQLLPRQWQLYKGIAHETLDAIHHELYRRALHSDGWPGAVLTPGVSVRTAGRIAAARLELHLEHIEQGTRARHTTEAVVLATGYRERRVDTLLAALDPYIRRDASERPRVDADHRLVLDPMIKGAVYVQNAERHTHGVGAPDLGLAAWRSATILNSLLAKAAYPLPSRTAFTAFGLQPSGRCGSVIGSPHLPDQRTPLNAGRN